MNKNCHAHNLLNRKFKTSYPPETPHNPTTGWERANEAENLSLAREDVACADGNRASATRRHRNVIRGGFFPEKRRYREKNDTKEEGIGIRKKRHLLIVDGSTKTVRSFMVAHAKNAFNRNSQEWCRLFWCGQFLFYWAEHKKCPFFLFYRVAPFKLALQ